MGEVRQSGPVIVSQDKQKYQSEVDNLSLVDKGQREGCLQGSQQHAADHSISSWLDLTKKVVLMDFAFRGILSAASTHLLFYLLQLLRVLSLFSVFLTGDLIDVFFSYAIWTFAGVLSYMASETFLGKMHKTWSYYFSVSDKKTWDMSIFTTTLLYWLPCLLLQLSMMSLFFPVHVVFVTTALTVLIAPFVWSQATMEEVMDRGLLMRMMQFGGFKDLSSYLCASGFFFSIAHFIGLVPFTLLSPWQAFLSYFSMGVVYAETAYYTQGIEASSALHTMHNLSIVMLQVANIFAQPDSYYLIAGMPIFASASLGIMHFIMWAGNGALRDVVVSTFIRDKYQPKSMSKVRNSAKSIFSHQPEMNLTKTNAGRFSVVAMTAGFSIWFSLPVFLWALYSLSQEKRMPLNLDGGLQVSKGVSSRNLEHKAVSISSDSSKNQTSNTSLSEEHNVMLPLSANS